MPFTPSHAAAALPFLRTPLLPSAMVIGSMAPDVPYYVPLGIPRGLTHSWAGVPTADLAITVVLVLLWYAALRAPVTDLAPAVVRLRMPELGPVGWRRDRTWPIAVVLVLAGAIVGILTHLVWDSFTHDGWLVHALPALQTQIGPLPAFKWLQHASTVAGLVVLAIWGVSWVRRTPPDAARRTLSTPFARVAAWVAVAVAFCGAGLVAWIRGIVLGVAPFDASLVFLGATVAGGSAGLVAVLICVVWWIRRARA